MNLVQFRDTQDRRRVARVDPNGEILHCLRGVSSLYELAMDAMKRGVSLVEAASELTGDESLEYAAIWESGRLLPPIDHLDPSHLIVSGTGLNHLGSAMARDAMHSKGAAADDAMTDSMKMFRWGVEGGKPEPGTIGVQPEWFFKGDGTCIVPPGHPLHVPSFAEDGGEEAELVGVYVIGADGEVWRVGFALGNEFSDHVMERRNYLYLAHSKLRQCSIGPEIVVGDLPGDLRGRVRILRDGKEVWSAPFKTGEDHMTHTLANMEHHHFKYPAFRRPRDIHVHFFGASILSVSHGVKLQSGDIVDISSPIVHRSLRNPVVVDDRETSPVTVRTL